jgi:hypothetical protein
MSNRLKARRMDRMPTRAGPASTELSSRRGIAAHMLGIVASFVLVIGLTYAAIGLRRMLF